MLHAICVATIAVSVSLVCFCAMFACYLHGWTELVVSVRRALRAEAVASGIFRPRCET